MWRQILAALMVSWGGAICEAAAARTDPCDPSSVPKAVRQALTATFPSWRVMRTADLEDPYHRELWLKAHAKECPGIAIGRFATRVAHSFAVLLIPTDPGKPGYKLVVFSTTQQGRVRAVVMEEVDYPIARSQVISRLPPGRYFNAERTRSVRLTLDGILIEQMEVGASLYYWSGGAYQRLAVSE